MKYDADKLAVGIWISGLMKEGPLTNNKMSKVFHTYKSWQEVYDIKALDIAEIMELEPDKELKIRRYIGSSEKRIHAINESKRCHEIYGEDRFKCVYINDNGYPLKLRELSTAPAVLYYCSLHDIDLLNKVFGVAVIGTRTPTYYGRKVTEEIIYGLKGTNAVIISGMARGIDSHAHISAIKTDILTAAVLGCGADIVYPPENRNLLYKIIDSGFIISECMPGTKPFRSYFPARNRIISGLSDCVLVTEASQESGTMITAGFAGDQGRDVFAVPGSVFSPHSTGTNQLLKDGAYVTTSSRDITNNFRYANMISPDNSAEYKQTNEFSAEFREDAKSISGMLAGDQLSFDEISNGIDLPVSKISEILSEGEIIGRFGFENGRYFLT